jgi:4-amino-4-deoxy-L-arabinose transferase-like glycosyltransferase
VIAAGPKTLRIVIWVLVGLGAVLRFRQYAANRSLWLDEALLALNILHRPLKALLGPLDYNQAAPLGFLLLERLATRAFGGSEYALRLLPLLSGLGALVLFRWLALRLLPSIEAGLAVFLFAVSPALVYYASETKQYSSDVLAALALWSLSVWEADNAAATSRRWWPMAVAGAVAIWLSHPAVFVLAAIAAQRCWRRLWERDRRAVAGDALAFLVWLGSFGALYLVSLRRITADSYLLTYWSGAFAPFPPTSVSDLGWYAEALYRLGALPLGEPVSALTALTGALGAAVLWRARRAEVCWILGPGLLALAASAMHRYPVTSRLWLFMVPPLLLLVAAGAGEIWRRTRPTLPLLAPISLVLLCGLPVAQAVGHAARPIRVEEIRPILEYVAQRRREGDLLYVYHYTQYPARYYAERGVISLDGARVGPLARERPWEYLRDLDRLRGRGRVWVLFSHVYTRSGLDEERFMLLYLDTIGSRLDGREATGASAYLYDMGA